MPEASAQIAAVREFFNGKHVAVTGAAGSVGQELIRQLLSLGVTRIVALDNDENGLFNLEAAFEGQSAVVPSFCDITSRDRLRGRFDGIDYVFHAAALKHVHICERTPVAAADVNVIGLVNTMEACMAAGVQRVIFTSSDKAVNPSNVMGASKLLGERIAASMNMRNGKTMISCTRFGNVAGSRGSVVPRFIQQILSKRPITLTSPEMTRFFMTLDDAVRLTINSMCYAKGGETFVTKMVTIRIEDLAKTMVKLLASRTGREETEFEYDVIGPRVGEKLYEELTTDEEQERTYNFPEYLVVQPVTMRHNLPEEIEYALLGKAKRMHRPYNSRFEQSLDSDAIAQFLTNNNLMPADLQFQKGARC